MSLHLNALVCVCFCACVCAASVGKRVRLDPSSGSLSGGENLVRLLLIRRPGNLFTIPGPRARSHVHKFATFGAWRMQGRLKRLPQYLMSETDGVIDEELDIEGEEVLVQRFVEADVGMTFPKKALHDQIFEKPWPEEYPFKDPRCFRRQDEMDDTNFYAVPRPCYHIDEGAVRALTNYYKENIPAGSRILDICSSWVSHYPTNFPETMPRISGTGMNAIELGLNKQLNDFEASNLNVEPKLPYEDNSFDVVTCVVSVDYLIHPLDIFREVKRVLTPGGKFILSQSNRCFPSKAIGMWLGMNDIQHCLVIGAYFHYSGGWSSPRAFDISPTGPRTNDPMFIVEANTYEDV